MTLSTARSTIASDDRYCNPEILDFDRMKVVFGNLMKTDDLKRKGILHFVC